MAVDAPSEVDYLTRMATAKKPYQPPKVVDYGSTSKLSAAKPGTLSDSPNSQNKTPCL
jgi:hypothetical protein